MSKICGFVLAAGEGRRIRPATLLRPKALLPFCGVPLLDLALTELLALPDLTCLGANACYLGEQVKDACARFGEIHGIDVHCSVEEHLLNHGGGIRKGVREFGGDADTIFVHNVDVIHDYDLRKILEFHESNQADVTALLIPNNREKGVEIDDGCNILDYHSSKSHLTFSGLYILKRDILDFLPEDEDAPSILTAFQNAAKAGRKVLGMVGEDDRFWSDVGTPAEYIRAHGKIADCGLTGQPVLHAAVLEQSYRRFALEQKGIQCTGALGLGENLNIPAGSHLHNVVIWDNTSLKAPGLYADGIICGGDLPAPLPPNDEKRMPDPRVFITMSMPAEEGKYEEPLKQGSGRRYCRIQNPKKGTGVIWSAYALSRRENSAFAPVAAFLCKLGVPVADIYLHLPEVGELVMEDLGPTDLLQLGHDERIKLLPQVLEQAALLHTKGNKIARADAVPLQPSFTPGYYEWERDYFRKNFIQDVLGRIELWDDQVARECRSIRERLLDEPVVLLHRDFQSANIKVRDGKCYWIDFQGMRLGAAAYDLASLLYDPYLEYTAEERMNAWRQYRDFVKAAGEEPPAEELLHIAAIERLMQALGAYGKLWKKDGLDWYKKHISRALRHLQQAATATKLPGFQRLAETALKHWIAEQ